MATNDTGRRRGARTSDAGDQTAAGTSTNADRFTIPGLEQGRGQRIAALLQARLVALTDLMLTLKHIHWNVVGPNFIGVHEMLDPQHAAVSAMVDEIAERIATLGSSPNGLAGALVAARDWDDYALARAGVIAHLTALDLVYDGVNTDHRAAIAELADLDPVTQDVLIDQAKQLEQFQWFVRAHLEDAEGNLLTSEVGSERSAALLDLTDDGPTSTRTGAARTVGNAGGSTGRGRSGA